MLRNLFYGTCAALLIILGSTFAVESQIVRKAGIAVAQTATQWNDVRDGAAGDALANGVLALALYGYNGTTFDRMRGDITNGLDVDVTRIAGGAQPSDAFANPNDALNTWSLLGLFDGTDWERARSVAPGDGTANPTVGVFATSGFPHLWDTVDWNRWFSSNGLLFTGNSGEGIGAVAPYVTDRTGSRDAWIGKIGRGGVIPSQTGDDNDRSTAANATITQSIAATANQRGMVHKVAAFCDAAGTATLTIESPPATVLWESTPGGVGTAYFEIDFPVGFAGPVNTQVDVVLTACGAGNTGHLMSQKSLF